MRLVERHIIQPRHRFFGEIDRLCWLSKNLYNYANYKVRQSFIFNHFYRPYNDIQKAVQGTEPYQALPAKVSQQVLRKVGGVGFRPAKLFKKTNQNFVQIPHAKLIEILSYKAKLAGIQVILTEESYTSKASFIDNDPIPVYKSGATRRLAKLPPNAQQDKGEKNQLTFSGKRVKRGLYRTGSGRLINADVNGSLNIMRKAVPNVFGYGIEGVVVHPVRVTPTR